MTGLMVRYSKKDKKEIKAAVKGLRMMDMPYYRLSVTNATAPRLVRALKSDKLKPKNKKSLILILEQFKRAKYKMKNIDESVITSMKKLMRKYMRSSEFFMFPVLMGNRLEVWAPAVRPEATRKYLSKMNQLGFKQRYAFLRLFMQKAGVIPAASQLIKNIKKSKTPLANIDQFKKDLKNIQTTVKK